MNIHIFHHIQYDCSKEEQRIVQKLAEIMGAVQDLKEQVAVLQGQVGDLQAAIDAHQDQDAATIAALNAQIVALEEAIANGATAEDLAAISASLTSVRDSVAAAKTDIEGGGTTTTAP